MEIKHRFTGKVIHSGEFETIKDCLLDAIKKGANLRGANLWGSAGNRREIRSLFISEVYSITYTSEYLQIGCERHLISEWWEFDDARIKEMGGQEALDFWGENKDFIRSAIEKYPATPAGKENEVKMTEYVYKEKPGRNMKQKPPNHGTKKIPCYKKKFTCQDGPLEGIGLWLTDGITAIMTIRGEKGHYNEGVWVPCK